MKSNIFSVDITERKSAYYDGKEHRLSVTMLPLHMAILVEDDKSKSQVKYEAIRAVQKTIIEQLKELMPEDLKFCKELDDIIAGSI